MDTSLLGSQKFLNYFWKRVQTPDGWLDEEDQNPCWEWIGYKDVRGYGRVSTSAGNKYAHRIAFMLNNGSIPEGEIVRHLCNNPSCVNPSHLASGSHKDNAEDRDRAGRNGTSGERHTWAIGREKLSAEDVHSILASVESRETTQRKLAERYGVSLTTIENIVHGRSRRNIAMVEV